MKKLILFTVFAMAFVAIYGLASAAKKTEAQRSKKTINAESSIKQAAAERTETEKTPAEVLPQNDFKKAGQIQTSGNAGIQSSIAGSSSSAAAGVQIKKYVIASGGGLSSTTGLRLGGTIGQTAIGRATTTSYSVSSGFWYGFPSAGGCCVGITGDLDSDGTPSTILDLTFIIDQIFRGGSDPLCLEEGDLDGDGTPLMVQDMTVMIDFIFRGGPEPSACPSPSPA